MRGHVSDTTLDSLDRTTRPPPTVIRHERAIRGVFCCCRWVCASTTSFTADRQRRREKNQRVEGHITATEKKPRAQSCFSSFRCSSIH